MAAQQMNIVKAHAAFDWARSLQMHAPVSAHHERAVKELRPWLKKLPRGHALEIGCGEPPFLLARLMRDIGWHVETLDVIEPACDHPGVDAHDLPFGDGSFDLVVARHVLEHVLIPPLVLMEMRRVSRRYLLIVVPWISDKAIDWPDHLYVLPQRAWERLFTHKLRLKIVRFEGGDHTEAAAKGLYEDKEWRFLLEKED